MQLQLLHLLVGDFDAFGVVGVHQVGVDFEASRGAGGAGVVEDRLVAVEGTAGPVLADLAEQPMLDGVPLRRRCRVVTDGHSEPVPVAQSLLQAELPGAGARPVAAAAIGEDEQLALTGVAALAVVVPPPHHVVDGEGCGVVRRAEEQVAMVGGQVVDAVGQGDALCVRKEVVVVDEGGLLAPGGALVLEVADQLSFLRVDADDRESMPAEGLALGCDVGELGVAVSLGAPVELLVVYPQPVVQTFEQLGDGIGAHLDTTGA